MMKMLAEWMVSLKLDKYDVDEDGSEEVPYSVDGSK